MKVRELIEELRKANPELEVIVFNGATEENFCIVGAQEYEDPYTPRNCYISLDV